MTLDELSALALSVGPLPQTLHVEILRLIAGDQQCRLHDASTVGMFRMQLVTSLRLMGAHLTTRELAALRRHALFDRSGDGRVGIVRVSDRRRERDDERTPEARARAPRLAGRGCSRAPRAPP